MFQGGDAEPVEVHGCEGPRRQRERGNEISLAASNGRVFLTWTASLNWAIASAITSSAPTNTGPPRHLRSACARTDSVLRAHFYEDTFYSHYIRERNP